jgi:microcystin-dependent protein
MTTPYLGEIKLASFQLVPKGWAVCNGQLLQINQNQALFSLLGTTYGGNGMTNFALPDLRGRMPVHAKYGVRLGEASGEFAHTLNANEMPSHSHRAYASVAQASTADPNGALLARKGRLTADDFNGTPNTTLVSTQVSNVGGSQPHDNTQPCLALNFIIALQGVFPTQT